MFRTFTRLAALFAASLAVLAGGALGSSAGAVQVSHAQGNPGPITAYQAYGWHANTCTATGGYCPKPRITIPGPLVGRANHGTAAQQLDATYRIYKYVGGSWQSIGSATRSYAINQQVLLPDFTWNIGAGGHFYVDIRFVWRVRSTGTLLAARTASWNGHNAADYRCLAAGCAAQRGYISLG